MTLLMYNHNASADKETFGIFNTAISSDIKQRFFRYDRSDLAIMREMCCHCIETYEHTWRDNREVKY